ncbi:hypothetical protein DFP72DRAFT_799218 [Ephemerocybe angulata]|uniref:ADF-H domain-containing protein n=1 Tax=Ephemerocybe angulata TaxID=980116 RepID=A0A8H6IGG5_9AGAR|nr:hypothetical protein DFP72DRAFT_799218 [Tulosesus angulatus]
MSATSGINPSQDLATQFAQAVESKEVRFLKISIQNESLVLDRTVPISGSLEQDLNTLQDDEVLQPATPAYVLVKLDQPSTDWLAIFYVPEDAKVRDKMLYASTRTNLLKGLGSTVFTDSIFATSKNDITPDAYRAHQRHQAAPKPLSSREQEIADLKVAENAAAGYDGSRSRASHVGTGVGLNWTPKAEEAISNLAGGDQCCIVILSVDPASESVVLLSASDIAIEDLPSTLPSSEPSYALLAWTYAEASTRKREIVFIYSCPSSSPIKNRMIYSSGSSTTFQSAKTLLTSSSPAILIAPRKIETSDPKEVDEAFLKAELGRSEGGSNSEQSTNPAITKPFAKPRGPGRRR